MQPQQSAARDSRSSAVSVASVPVAATRGHGNGDHGNPGRLRRPVRRARASSGRPGAALNGRLLPYLLLAPTMVVIATFLYYPMARTAYLSFFDVALLGRRLRFVGFDNFRELFVAENLSVVVRTAVISGLVVVLAIGSALGAAALLNMKIRGTRIYRLLLIWPLALSTAVAGVMFLMLFNPTFGSVNVVLRVFGVNPQWFTKPILAQAVLILALVWMKFGYNLVFYSAAFQNLPQEPLDAALVDGASPWQRFRHVTVPLLSPVTLFLFVTNTSFAFFDSFAMIHVMTRGGPLDSTTLMIYDVYQNAFQFRRTGLAAAEAMLMFVAVVAIILLQLRLTRRRVHYGS